MTAKDTPEAPTDLIALKHPKLGPEDVVVYQRSQVPTMAEAGWVEDKSPEAKALVAEAERVRGHLIEGDNS